MKILQQTLQWRAAGGEITLKTESKEGPSGGESVQEENFKSNAEKNPEVAAQKQM